MASGTTFRTTCDKAFIQPITKCCWNHKVDVIAVCLDNGELHVHRINGQKVWSVPAPSQGAEITSISWSPDGRSLYVSYLGGIHKLLGLEKPEELHVWNTSHSAVASAWAAARGSLDTSRLHRETAHLLLPRCSSRQAHHSDDKREGEVRDPRQLDKADTLTVLAVADSTGTVHCYTHGFLLAGSINLPQALNDTTAVLSLEFCEGVEMLYVVYTSPVNHCAVSMLRVPLLTTRAAELHLLAKKMSVVDAYLQSVHGCLLEGREAWEEAVLELEERLEGLSRQKAASVFVPRLGSLQLEEGEVSLVPPPHNETLCDDFLELLALGMCSEDMRIFLVDQLGEKGLKKLSATVDASFKTVEKVFVERLNPQAQALQLAVSEVVGLSEWRARFSVLGLEQRLARDALGATASFLIKVSETHRVLDHSMINFSTFAKWLSSALLMLDRKLPPVDRRCLTREETERVQQFILDCFSSDPDSGLPEKIRLEKLTQYFRDQPLQDVTPPSPFTSFVNRSPSLQASEVLYKHRPETSLMQELMMLQESLRLLAESAGGAVQNTAEVRGPLVLMKEAPDDSGELPTLAHVVEGEGGEATLYTVVVSPGDGLTVTRLALDQLRQESRGALSGCAAACWRIRRLALPSADHVHLPSLQSVASFTSPAMLVLASGEEEEEGSFLVQADLSVISDEAYTPLIAGGASARDLAQANRDRSYDVVDPAGALALGVCGHATLYGNGPRGTAALVCGKGRRLRVLLAEPTEDDTTEIDDD